MITEFVQRISSRIGRRLNRHHLAGPLVRHPVKLYEIKPVLGRLKPNEHELFSLAATGSFGEPQADRRSLIVQFTQPTENRQEEEISLRFKGVYPEVVEGKVNKYARGSGFVPTIIEPADGAKLFANQERSEHDYLPAGTMSAECLQTEVETALTLGPEISDELLGFGYYENLSFNSEPIGFVYYAMDRIKDLRLLQIVNYSREATFAARFSDAAWQAGNLLRMMHDLGLAHRYPHLANFTWDNSAQKVKLVDLDTAIELAGLPRETRLAWLYLDLSRTIIDFYGTYLFGKPGAHYGTTMVELLPHLFSGYFRTEVNFPPGFPRELKGLTESGYEQLLVNSIYWRPRYLAEQNIGSQIDLRQYVAETPDFQPFWQALTSVAETIR